MEEISSKDVPYGYFFDILFFHFEKLRYTSIEHILILMSNNDVILVTSSYDHSFIFWDATTGSTKHDINYGDKVIVNRIDTS